MEHVATQIQTYVHWVKHVKSCAIWRERGMSNPCESSRVRAAYTSESSHQLTKLSRACRIASSIEVIPTQCGRKYFSTASAVRGTPLAVGGSMLAACRPIWCVSGRKFRSGARVLSQNVITGSGEVRRGGTPIECRTHRRPLQEQTLLACIAQSRVSPMAGSTVHSSSPCGHNYRQSTRQRHSQLQCTP